MLYNISMAIDSGMKESLTTAFGAVKTDVIDIIGVALPVALGIVGVGIAISLGIKYFKKFAK